MKKKGFTVFFPHLQVEVRLVGAEFPDRAGGGGAGGEGQGTLPLTGAFKDMFEQIGMTYDDPSEFHLCRRMFDK